MTAERDALREAMERALPRILLATTNNTSASPDAAPAKEWGREVARDLSRALEPEVAQFRAVRDLLANYLWNEDDSGNEADLEAAYHRLEAIFGPSSEESIARTQLDEAAKILRGRDYDIVATDEWPVSRPTEP